MEHRLLITGTIAALAGTAQGGAIVAADDFDNPVNLISYSAIDAEGFDPSDTGVWPSPRDNFGVREMRDRLNNSPSGNYLSETLVDASTSEDIFDENGILTPDYGGRFFAICDTDNGVNPSGLVTGTWVFDISGASGVGEFSVDLSATGNWYDDGEGGYEQFVFAYSIDGGAETTLLQIRGDASAGAVTYTLDSGFSFSVPGNTASGVDDNGAAVYGGAHNGTVLLNELATFTAPMTGSGDRLELTLTGYINDNNAGMIIDNIAILEGEAFCPADLTTDGANPGNSGYGVPDGQVSVSDLTYFVEQWIASELSIADVTTDGANPGDSEYGVPDGQVSVSDLTYFVEQWIAGCP